MQRIIARIVPVLAAAALCTACTEKKPATAEKKAPAKAEAAEKEKAAEPAKEEAALERTKSPAGAKVFFKSPADGAKVKGPVKLEFGIEGMEVVKAGVDKPDTGHHHLIVDADLPDMNAPIPSNDNYIHYGTGATSAEVKLEPGEHKLQMLLGDHRHIPHDPPVYSEVITITVE